MILLAVLTGSMTALGQSVSLKMTLDSAYVLMGKATPLHVELLAPESAQGQLLIPEDTICKEVEVLKLLPADTSSIGNGRVRIDRQVMLQAFDSGTYMLNPVIYVNGNETISSNRLVLKVIPVDVDSLTTIHDYADVVDPSRHLVDYLPDFVADYGAWILAIIIVAVIAWLLVRRYMRREIIAEKKIVVIPPYELARQELEQLQADHLCEHGREKEFYTRLTEILRRYLQGRFGINAMEMTSTQIRSILATNEETRLTRRNMEQVLETADFVKFAKVRPLPDDNARAYQSAVQFVEDTKPAPPPADDDDHSETDDGTPLLDSDKPGVNNIHEPNSKH